MPSGRLNAALIKMHIHIFPSSLSLCNTSESFHTSEIIPPTLLLL